MISISIAAVRIPSLSLPDRPLIKSSLPACPAVLPIEQRIVSKVSHLIRDVEFVMETGPPVNCGR